MVIPTKAALVETVREFISRVAVDARLRGHEERADST
jgi:hypothetical protein